MALQFVRHAFMMVFGNLGQALRVSAGPILLTVAIIFLMAKAFKVDPPSIMMMFMHPETANPMIALLLFGGLFLVIFVASWVAVSWHRFILKEEYAHILPAIANRPIGSYIWMSIKLGLLVALASFVINFVGGVLIAVLGLQGSFVAGFVLGLASGVLTSYLWFRIALTLPASAVAEPMRIADSLAQTDPAKNTIFQVVLIMVGINLLIQLCLAALIGLPGPVFLVFGGAMYWLNFMVGLSILTTLYGHLIEKRPLVE
jgi:hypothetical protein